MYWLILLFRKSVIKNPGYQYWRFAIKTQQQSDILSEIIDAFVKNGFELSTGYSDERWYNPNNDLSAIISLDVYGFIPNEYQIVTVDELSQILQSANL